MKKHFLLALLFLNLLACENEFNPAIVDNFSISQIITVQGDQNQVQDFEYDTNGKLVSVNHNINTNSNEFIEVTDFIYENNQLALKTFRYQSTDTLHRQDSIAYLGNGQIDKIYSAYNYEGNMVVSWVRQYEYDNNGKLRVQTSYNPTSPENQISERYYWKDGNVDKIESYNGNTLRYESSYTYDNKPNYKLNNPFFSDFELSLANKNNLTKVAYTDYSGLLDLACNPCNYGYEYNDFNLPKKVTYDWGSTLYITYEIFERASN